MNRVIKNTVGLGALLTFAMLSSPYLAVAQDSLKRPKAIGDRPTTPATGGLSSQRTAEKFAVLLPTRIVNVADSLRGHTVKPGQCTDFVEEVLRLSEAKGSFPDTMVIVEDKKVKKIETFGWGKHYVALGKGKKPIMPKAGDIIQFESCRFEDGRGGWWEYGTPHHTAIVKSVKGSVVTLLHQNVDGKLELSKVREQQIDLSWLKRGHWRSYEAIPRDGGR